MTSKRNAALEALGAVPMPLAPVPVVAEEPAVKPAKRYAKVMVYCHPKVARKFKEIAFTEDRKANDVYLEALDLYLTRAGHGGIDGVTGR
jgi:hypothetical protein